VQILDDILAAPDDGLLRCDCAVGLHAELEGSEERVRNFVGREDDVVVLEETLGEEVAECVILLVECEDGGIGYACVALLARFAELRFAQLTGLFLVLNLLLAVVQQEELESRWHIVRTKLYICIPLVLVDLPCPWVILSPDSVNPCHDQDFVYEVRGSFAMCRLQLRIEMSLL
jgi:hypothetical protein